MRPPLLLHLLILVLHLLWLHLHRHLYHHLFVNMLQHLPGPWALGLGPVLGLGPRLPLGPKHMGKLGARVVGWGKSRTGGGKSHDGGESGDEGEGESHGVAGDVSLPVQTATAPDA